MLLQGSAACKVKRMQGCASGLENAQRRSELSVHSGIRSIENAQKGIEELREARAHNPTSGVQPSVTLKMP